MKTLFWTFVVLAYQFTPIDIATDVVPVIGSIDDLLLAYYAARKCLLDGLPKQPGTLTDN